MLSKTLFLAVTATALFLLSDSRAQAWGAAHVGYTHVGPNGVQHYGATAAVGPNGAYGSRHASAYGYGGAAHYGAAGGYHYGGYNGAAYGGAYRGGYVRRW